VFFILGAIQIRYESEDDSYYFMPVGLPGLILVAPWD